MAGIPGAFGAALRPDAPGDRPGSEERRARLAFLLIVGSSLAFAISDSLVKVAVAALPPAHLVFYRNAIGLVLLLGVLRVRGEPLAPRNVGVMVLRGLFGCAALLLLFSAIARTELAHAILLNKTSPIFTTVLAATFLRQRVSRATVAGALIAAPGVWLTVVRPDQPAATAMSVGPLGISAGAALALLSGLASGAAQTSLSHASRSDRSGIVVLFFCATAAALTLPWIVLHPVWPSAAELPALLGIAVFATGGQVLMTEAYQRASASAVSTSSLQNVVFIAVIGVLAFGEVPTARAALGGLLVLLGGVVATLTRSRPLV